MAGVFWLVDNLTVVREAITGAWPWRQADQSVANSLFITRCQCSARVIESKTVSDSDVTIRAIFGLSNRAIFDDPEFSLRSFTYLQKCIVFVLLCGIWQDFHRYVACGSFATSEVLVKRIFYCKYRRRRPTFANLSRSHEALVDNITVYSTSALWMNRTTVISIRDAINGPRKSA